MATVTFTKETDLTGYTIIEQVHAGGVCGEGILIDQATGRGMRFLTWGSVNYWIEKQGMCRLDKNLWRMSSNKTCRIMKYSTWVKRSAK